jgi:hydroxymethylpyrimidine/phosphomethylpyrimidine kinase
MTPELRPAGSGSETRQRRPRVLVIAGHDPTGGAGVQADIETLLAHGVRPLTLISALTAQDSCGLKAMVPQPVLQFRAQAELLLQDIRFDVVKLGALGSAAIATEVARLLEGWSGPIVLDPVLAAGGGATMADAALIEVLRDTLLPLCTLVTPNLPEAARLLGVTVETDLAHLGGGLNDLGARAVLLTGTHAATPAVVNRLYRPREATLDWSWPRLPASYHGSGCTLASAIAARLAQGADMVTAVADAQQYTWQALSLGGPLGRGQLHPERLPPGPDHA